MSQLSLHGELPLLLWLLLNRTAANKPNPGLDKAAFKHQEMLQESNFGKKIPKTNKPDQINTKTNTNHWKLERDGAE